MLHRFIASMLATLLLPGLAALWGCQPEPAAPAENGVAPAPDPPTVAPRPQGRRASGEMRHEALLYTAGEMRLLGHLARLSDPGDAPVLILMHDEFGIDSWMRDRAESYARLGYVAVVPDLTDLTPMSPDSQIVDNAKAAVAAAEELLGRAPSDRLAAIGWSVGGTHALTLARNMDLETVIVCYGDLMAETELLLGVTEPVLGVFGHDDPRVTPERVEEFRVALDRMGGLFTGQIWRGEEHHFLRTPRRPTAAREAEAEIITWLDENFPP